ncbi:MAG: M23 family metallopeptidase, partial [Symploca sp. SIO2B6]|nr:M23 family metallopeptidase [Symploca sp. SIO2B6]
MLHQPYKLYKRLSGATLLGLGLLGFGPILPNTAHGSPESEYFDGRNKETLPFIKQETVPGCPPSVLEQTISHPVQQGETLALIAESYGLSPSSIVSLNPSLQSGALREGDRLTIPPHDGVIYEIAPGTPWQALADAYGIRADVLFESNGCGATPPTTVFVPGLGTRAQAQAAYSLASEPQAFSLFPIAQEGDMENVVVALGYGWQQPPTEDQPLFHSGMDWSIPVGTPVQSVGEGTVAFAGEQGDYGVLVVINHEQGVQTRYAQLSTTQVSVGDVESAGTIIGLSGESGTALMPHLHFEVRLNSNVGWVAQDPLLYLA